MDLSAVVYPTLQRRDFSSVYRLSVVLKEKINPELLQKAVEITMERFPTYKVAIRKGVFWRYLETNTRPGPYVEPDIKNPCMPMPFKSNNRYPVRFYYHERRISFEAHHSLGDGTGGMFVLQTLIAVYLRLTGKKISCGGFVLDVTQKPDPEELEDAYIRYARATVCPKRKSERAYRVCGTKEPFYTLNIIDGIMSVNQLKKIASKYGVTITEYLNSVLLYALLQKQENDKPYRIRPVKIAMPVNLRQFFPSKTLRNFITMVYPSIDPRLGEYSFDEIIEHVHYFMKYYVNDKFMRGDITTNYATRTNPVLRIVPLFIKDIVVRKYYSMIQDKNSSAGLTNMGKINVNEDMKPFIERFDIYMGQPFSSRTNCAIASFEDILTVNFASSIKEADVEMLFFKKLVKDGVHVKIESNR